ncbi:MAG: glycosyltransferase family 4 protein [Candidatus Binatus sp.]|uniref:glycosyltransferase family 4 protein n=1 Tax=Candidatus Binatus sp. TaxID=2811406 RepID=UPI00271F859F|nr:glycosyltransferase family 4 protein [Candidatus Binatus sp.]MDO8431592.1 glycosyltransferase family 4 protein [Candidatus Binatus sp.]
MTAWNIITGHYPPQPGGVSDYTRLIAHGLAEAGDRVSVWTSRFDTGAVNGEVVRVNRLPDHFGRAGLVILNRELHRERAARVLVEYVPHAFGMKAMNVPLCMLLLRHRRRDITVMFHEVAYPIERGQQMRRNLLGIVNRAMAAILARAASRIFVAAEAWKEALGRLAPRGCDIRWLPVPSTIGVSSDRAAILDKRARFAEPGVKLLGHFGSYGPLVAARLKPALISILSTRSDVRIILIGRNSETFRDSFAREHRLLASRVIATGPLDEADVSASIGACDFMIQPYPDGITSRNTSALAGLAYRKPVVTTTGRWSETLWARSGAVMLAPDGDPDALAHCAFELMDNRERANTMGCAAIKLYHEVFDVRHTIDALRNA